MASGETIEFQAYLDWNNNNIARDYSIVAHSHHGGIEIGADPIYNGNSHTFPGNVDHPNYASLSA